MASSGGNFPGWLRRAAWARRERFLAAPGKPWTFLANRRWHAVVGDLSTSIEQQKHLLVVSTLTCYQPVVIFKHMAGWDVELIDTSDQHGSTSIVNQQVQLVPIILLVSCLWRAWPMAWRRPRNRSSTWTTRWPGQLRGQPWMGSRDGRVAPGCSHPQKFKLVQMLGS